MVEARRSNGCLLHGNGGRSLPHGRLKQNHWPRVLFAAAAYPALLPILAELRAQGAAVIQLPTGRLKLVAGTTPPATWAELAGSKLAPHRDPLIRLLAHAARGYITLRSSVLNGELIHLTGDAAWLDEAERRRLEAAGEVFYTLEEAAGLVGLGAEGLRAVHLAKKVVQGEVVREVTQENPS